VLISFRIVRVCDAHYPAEDPPAALGDYFLWLARLGRVAALCRGAKNAGYAFGSVGGIGGRLTPGTRSFFRQVPRISA